MFASRSAWTWGRRAGDGLKVPVHGMRLAESSLGAMHSSLCVRTTVVVDDKRQSLRVKLEYACVRQVWRSICVDTVFRHTVKQPRLDSCALIHRREPPGTVRQKDPGEACPFATEPARADQSDELGRIADRPRRNALDPSLAVQRGVHGEDSTMRTRNVALSTALGVDHLRPCVAPVPRDGGRAPEDLADAVQLHLEHVERRVRFPAHVDAAQAPAHEVVDSQERVTLA